MPDFLLRKNAVVPGYPDTFLVIQPMDDGYELEVGQIAQQTGRSMVTFWGWSCPGTDGRSDSRESAMAALKKAWQATDKELAELRHQQEWTANKYALFDGGYRDQIKRGAVQCPCGATFNPRMQEETMAHISHITGRAPGT